MLPSDLWFLDWNYWDDEITAFLHSNWHCTTNTNLLWHTLGQKQTFNWVNILVWWGLFDILSGLLNEWLGDAQHGHTLLTDKIPLTPAHNQAGLECEQHLWCFQGTLHYTIILGVCCTIVSFWWEEQWWALEQVSLRIEMSFNPTSDWFFSGMKCYDKPFTDKHSHLPYGAINGLPGLIYIYKAVCGSVCVCVRNQHDWA